MRDSCRIRTGGSNREDKKVFEGADISAIKQDKRTPSVLFLAKLAEELGVSIDYLVSGKEGIINGAIPAIKADKRLNLKAKRALIALAEELRELAVSEEAKGGTHNPTLSGPGALRPEFC